MALTDVWEDGGAGGDGLAKEVLKVMEEPNNFAPIYEVEQSVEEKLTAIVQKVYGGTASC